MKFERMMRILFELMSKKSVKASYLAQKFEVSVRSIHRYISSLELAGVPIYTIRGNQGGFSIVDTYRFSTSFMTKKEFEQTINALSAICDSVPNKELESVINKFKSAIKYDDNGFSLNGGNLIIDAGPWGDTVGYKNKLIVIQDCIENNKKLLIKYHDRNGEITERTIDPHLIVFKQGLWYVFAYCNLRNEFRFFKTGRIEKAIIKEEKFTRQDLSKMDLPTNFWHASVNALPVILEIKKSCLSDVEEWLGVENVKKSGDKFIADVLLPIDNGLIMKLMSFGDGIKVIEPISLQKKIKDCADKILKSYNS